eukprot:TRINITY_DN28430_c0_g1_i3.p1 TRINITY_DN28430_c0_g1~~TRINITY_DN28430_c0_g1_i3.p1  ORF type:complete len:151 (+),score=37.92 TRINITY_DN28430_c0_g1_i3:30-482(+)
MADSILWRVQERLNREDARREIQEYCEAAAAQFDFSPEQLAEEGADGYDHRHDWYDLHRGFAEMIERLLEEACAAEGVERSAFLAECQAVLANGAEHPTMVRFFLSMLLEMRAQLAEVEARPPPPPPPPEEDALAVQAQRSRPSVAELPS